jgi:hypothetical protein
MPQLPSDRIQIRRQSRFARQRLSYSFLFHRLYMGWPKENDTVRLTVRL